LYYSCMRRWSLGAISIVALGAFCFGLTNTHAAILTSADAAAMWVDNSVGISVDLDSGTVSDPDANYWNIPCTVTRHPDYNSSYGGLRTIDDCIQQTTYGAVGQNNIALLGSDTSYVLKDSRGAKLTNFYAIPGTNHLLI